MTWLDAHVVVEREGWRLDVELDVPGGSVLALLGPNGAGKSTALRVVAGLLPASAGHVRVGNRTWDDHAAGVRLATEQRSLGVVFQDYLLFPTMTARDNVAFGMRAKGIDKVTARERADAWLTRVDLHEQAGRRPAQLSGGQAGCAAGMLGLVESIRQLTGQNLANPVPNARFGIAVGFGMITYDRGLCSGAAVLSRADA